MIACLPVDAMAAQLGIAAAILNRGSLPNRNGPPGRTAQFGC
jgi:hypothetical protein